MWFTLVLLATLQPSAAAEVPEEPAGATETTTPAADPSPEAGGAARALQEAVARYQAGDTLAARETLQQLLAQGPSLPDEVKEETLAWLGDILLGEQGPAAAHSAFEALLTENPDFMMDPFEHPPEVVNAFELVRTELRARAPIVVPIPAPLPVPRYPAAVLIPGGVHYFQQGKPLAGTVVGGLQLGGAAVSVVSGIKLVGLQDVLSDDAEAERQFRRTKAVNNAASVIAWAAWSVPVFVETVRWGQTRSVSIGVAPTTLTIAARF